MRKKIILLALALIAEIVLFSFSLLIAKETEKDRRSSAATAKIVLRKGTHAAGGMVVVSAEGVSVEVQTHRGQTATEVAEQIAAAVNQSSDFQEFGIFADVHDTMLSFPTSVVYVCSSCEADLGIPAPPQKLQCLWDKKEQTLFFLWDNPIHYDAIVIVDSTNIRINDRRLDSGASSYTHHVKSQPSGIFPGRNKFSVVGITNGIGCATSCEVEFY